MKKRILIPVIAAGCIAGTAVKAALFKEKRTPGPELPSEKADADRAALHLSEAIRIKTISRDDPQQVDWSQFEKFHDFLEKAYPLITKNLSREKVSRASLLYKWQGKNDTLKPIAFLSHMDVVPVSDGTLDDWEHPPFDGFNDGEFIWGRGALDMKNHLICVMESIETLLEEGFEPERSIYLCFGHNEEIVAAEESGAGAIMETLRARGVELDSIIDEGGAMLPANVKGILEGNLAGIGIAEKGYADFRLTLKAKGGHSSQPPKHTAIGELSKAVLRLENHQFKAKLPDYVNDMFISIGKRCSYAGRLVMCNYPILKPAVKYAMTKIPPAASLIRTTIGVTMSSGSPAANVLPQSASVTVNCRIMPGESIASTKEHIRKAIKNDKIEIELIKGKEPSCISPTDSKSFRTLKKLSVAANQNNIVTPYLVMGGTDAYHYEPICKNIYRFAPFTISTSLLLTTHSTNERCPIEQLGAGITFFKRYIREMAGKE